RLELGAQRFKVTLPLRPEKTIERFTFIQQNALAFPFSGLPPKEIAPEDIAVSFEGFACQETKRIISRESVGSENFRRRRNLTENPLVLFLDSLLFRRHSDHQQLEIVSELPHLRFTSRLSKEARPGIQVRMIFIGFREIADPPLQSFGIE